MHADALAPEPGKFLDARVVAHLLESDLDLLLRHRQWCGWLPANKHFDLAIEHVRQAIDALKAAGRDR